MMARTSRTMPSRLPTFMASRIRVRSRRLMRRPAAKASPMPMEVMPKPPIWISTAITACPTGVKVSAVSTVSRPVTQTALVAENRASTGCTVMPGRMENGMSNKSVPSKMVEANPRAINLAGG